MTDPTEKVGAYREEIAGGVSVEFEPVEGGEMKLAAIYDGETLVSGQYTNEVFAGTHRGRTDSGEFLNRLEDVLAELDGVDPQPVRTNFQQWFAEMGDMSDEEEAEYLLTDDIQAIIEGTHYPVEIHGSEDTTWKVELTFAGRTRELEFSTAEWVGGGAAALKEKIANQFFEVVEIEKEDWESIRDRWQENSEVVNVVEETASDAIADRVLTKLSNTVKPVADRDHMGNDVAAAWYDPQNKTGYPDAGNEPIVWVQDSFLVDQLESAGKGIEYKGQLVKNLIARGDLHGSRARKTWAWDSRTKVYPFDPEALGVSGDDVGTGDDPNHSEVSV